MELANKEVLISEDIKENVNRMRRWLEVIK